MSSIITIKIKLDMLQVICYEEKTYNNFIYVTSSLTEFFEVKLLELFVIVTVN